MSDGAAAEREVQRMATALYAVLSRSGEGAYWSHAAFAALMTNAGLPTHGRRRAI